MIRATGLLDSAFAWPSGRASLLAAASGSEEYPNHNAVCKTVAADTRRRRRRNRETAAGVFTRQKAEFHMLQVHRQGKSVLARESPERAEHYVHQLQSYSLHATMERDA